MEQDQYPKFQSSGTQYYPRPLQYGSPLSPAFASLQAARGDDGSFCNLNFALELANLYNSCSRGNDGLLHSQPSAIMRPMLILAIETSCDETAVALYEGTTKQLLAHHIHSQVELHAQYGGVVPELASRDHIRFITPLVNKALETAGVSAGQLEGVAYTAGPGLVGALLVGATFGRAFAFSLGIPAIGIHHMEAHLLVPMLEDTPPSYPFLGMLVSGGHTMLVKVMALGDYEVIGESLDDAVGEAFDKTAKLLGLGYPGGPAVSALAEKGDPHRFTFPRPMVQKPGLDFSFSGLKTHVRTTWEASDKSDTTRADICRAFQDAVVDTFRIKCTRALKQTNLPQLVVAGGVSANSALRNTLNKLGKDLSVAVFFPRQEFCTDNAAMVAYAGHERLSRGQQADLTIDVRARWPMSELSGA